MKKRAIILLVAVLIALLAGRFWSRWPTDSTSSQRVASQQPDLPNQGQADVVTPPLAPASSAPPAGQAASLQRKVEMLHEIATSSNMPIQFYGLVLDQDNNPIPGVKVTLSIRTTKETMPGAIHDEFEEPVVSTDGQGRFAITDAQGALLSVKSLDKAGYEASEKSLNRAHYWYWRDPQDVFHPDPAKPEVFRMWKKMGAETLVRKGIGHAIPYNGSPTTFDLIEDRAATPGDLRVTLVRDPQQIHWGQINFEWTVTIEAVDGGVIESSDEQMYGAPADGYQSTVVIHMPADDPHWTDTKNVALYLKLRGGKYYGRAELKFMVGSDRPTTPFSITSYVNPSGSRNLEYDPLQGVLLPPAAP